MQGKGSAADEDMWPHLLQFPRAAICSLQTISCSLVRWYQYCAPWCVSNGAAGMNIVGRRRPWAGSCPRHIVFWGLVVCQSEKGGNGHTRRRTASFWGQRPSGHKSELGASPITCPWGGRAGETGTGTPRGDGRQQPLHCPAFSLPQALTLAFSNLQ